MSSADSAVPLGPPPTPFLVQEVDNLLQYNSGLSNAGGSIQMYSSVDGNPPWTEEGVEAWALTFDWGDVAFLPALFLTVTSIGNDTAYVGESDRSNVFDNNPP